MKVAIIGDKKNTKSLAMELAIKCNIPIVVESFYCNSDDGEYHNDPCAEQCRFCKSAESLQ